MYILAIETTGPIGSVALVDETGRMAVKSSREEMNHLKDLIPMTEQILKEFDLPRTGITAVAASIGPGSFTGIRIGVSTARALAQALDIPCIAVPTLGAFSIIAETRGELTAVLFNARRGQVYGAIFGPSGEEVLAPGPYLLSEVLPKLREAEKTLGPATVYGDGIDAYEDYLAGFVLTPKEERYQNAELIALAARRLYFDGKIVSYSDLKPDYMRITEAEQKLKDGTLARQREAKMAKFMGR
jgi:universal bacterial protein YeaZ